MEDNIISKEWYSGHRLETYELKDGTYITKVFDKYGKVMEQEGETIGESIHFAKYWLDIKIDG